MRHNSDAEFLERCREVDFSAESVNYEKNLDALKAKLTTEERFAVNKIRKMPVAVAAALAVVLSLSVVALGATVWRHMDTRIIQGEEYVRHFSMQEATDGSGFTMGSLDIDPNASGPIIADVEGEKVVLWDAHEYDDLDAALARLSATLGDLKMPAYLPEGFTFEQATYHANVTALNIDYSFGGQELRVRISHYPEEWGIPQWSATFEEVEVNGWVGKTGDGSLWVQVGDISYFFDGYNSDLDYDHLIRIAKSLR
ncbi:MAG: DUF4367 domain-containing protein [Oscillospiraceae bacterium]|nr:DUF4367 domain-containing protein [Oscillospiraceae bacterium]